MSGDILTLTPAALMRVQALLAQKEGTRFFRIGVKKGGCNGFTYDMQLVERMTDGDISVVQDDFTLLIAPQAELFLTGSVLDYVEDDLKAEFKITNPNIKGECGCGESFSV